MYILGIESSCDDTSVALVEASEKHGLAVVCQKTVSQIDIHKHYGGVVPEIAGRKHAEYITPLVEEVLHNNPKPDVIAVTHGPGLITGLLVGIETSKVLSYLWGIPIVAVNHIDGHIHSVELNDWTTDNRRQTTNSTDRSQKSEVRKSIAFPALCLIVSGGHTELIVMETHGNYTRIGATRDDAAGECFDKVGKLLGFEYPGGPKIAATAQSGDATAIAFPRPMKNSDNLDFSFAGLKTAALYWLQDHAEKKSFTYSLPPSTLQNFCAGFQAAIIDVLVTKTLKAAKVYNPKTIILAGGVSANTALQHTLSQQIGTTYPSCVLRIPKPFYHMDNGAMIAAAGYYKAVQRQYTPWQELSAFPVLRIA